MAKEDFFKRYIDVVELLRRKSVSSNDLQNYLNQNLKISLRTFQRDKGEIERLYGIEIAFNKKEGLYKINEELSDGSFDRLTESFHITQALNKSNEVSKIILLEQRKSKGMENMHGLLHAIHNRLVINFLHESYWNYDIKKRKCVPIAIKEAQHRWYLIAFDIDKKEFRNYGLDRISDLVISTGKHTVPEFNIKEYYKNAFGIDAQGEPYKVILKIANYQKKFLNSLPLHHSQKIVEENETHFKLEFFIQLSHDFKTEILKLGSFCEVLEPIHFRNEVIEEINRLKNIYKK